MRDCVIAAGGDPSVIPDNEPPRLLRLREVEERVGLRASTIYERIAAGTFPRPILISGRTSPPEVA